MARFESHRCYFFSRYCSCCLNIFLESDSDFHWKIKSKLNNEMRSTQLNFSIAIGFFRIIKIRNENPKFEFKQIISSWSLSMFDIIILLMFVCVYVCVYHVVVWSWIYTFRYTTKDVLNRRETFFFFWTPSENFLVLLRW